MISFSHGIENALEYRPDEGNFTGDIYYTYNRVEDSEGNTPDYKPRHTVGLQGGLHWPAIDTWTALTVDYVSTYSTFDGDIQSRGSSGR